jgi:hypothetical protein
MISATGLSVRRQGHRALAGIEAWRFDGNGAKERHQPTGTHVFQRPPGLASLADLAAAAVLLGLGLDQMTLRLRRYLLSLRKRQPNHPRRIFDDGRTAAKFVSRDRPVSWTNFNSNITRHLVPHSSLSPWSRNVHPQVLDGPLWHVATY